MKGQKEAVVDEVKRVLSSFRPYKDIALVMLTSKELDALKATIGWGIRQGYIEYSKDIGKVHEVMSYARSMVMNHLKKAKELNGNQTYGGIKPVIPLARTVPVNLDMSILPPELREFVESLV